MDNACQSYKSLQPLTRGEVSYSELKNGWKGVSLAEGFYFIRVWKDRQWFLQLYEGEGAEPLTGKLCLKKLESLRHPAVNKPLKSLLKQEWSNPDEIIEWIIIEIEEHLDKWLEGDSGDVKLSPGTSEDALNSPEAEPSESPEAGAGCNIDENLVEAEVQRILNSENQLEALQPHLDNIIAGERETKKLCLILCLGSKVKDDTSLKQIILFKGSEGAGKSTVTREITSLFKVKEVGRLTAHALDYMNLNGYEILLLKEIGTLDEEKQGISTIKFLSIDDKGYTVEATIRDRETGEFTTKTYRIPPITVVSTTTRIELDPQFQRRAWILSVDETPEQTENVLKWKAKLERQRNEVKLGLRKWTDYDFSKAVLRRFIEKVEPCKVIIPFTETLTEILSKDVLRVRGDYDKLLCLIKLYAMLNRKRLTRLEAQDAYIVTPEVCMEALKLGQKPLADMIFGLEERTRKLFEAIEKVLKDKAEPTIDKDDREKIAVIMRKSERTILAYLKGLEAQGYLASNEGKPKVFKLLYSLTELREKLLGESAILKSADSLMDKMRKEAQKWLNSLSANQPPLDACVYVADGSNIISKPSHTHTNSRGERFADVEKDLEKPSLGEKSSENLQFSNLQIHRGDSYLKADYGHQPSIPEVYEFLRKRLNKPFSRDEAISLIADLRQCSLKEAERLLQILIDDGKLFQDPNGLWHWTSGAG